MREEPATDYLAIASRLAQESARRIMDLPRESLSKSHKKDLSLVTEADLLSDEILRGGLMKHFPDHAILTEETGWHGSPQAEWTWLIDPLDGTKAYAKGIAGFSVLVGLLKADRPYLGVIVDPWDRLVYEAIRGQGAFLTQGKVRKKIRVSSRKDFKEMPFVTSTDVPQALLEKAASALGSPVRPAINSVGIKAGLIVRQVADIYFNHHSVHYWDTCAPQVILEEAGGKITRLDGSPLEYKMAGNQAHNSPTLATNGTRHADVTSLLYPLFLETQT